MSNHYKNLIMQAEKLYRHNRQGSFKTKERYYEAYKRFLHFIGNVYHLQKLQSISGKHLAAYIEYMQEKGYSASTIKTDLAAIRFWHDQIPDAKYVLPTNSEFLLERRKFGGIDRTWSPGEFNKMIAQCWNAKRDDYAACITIARYAGLRLHEVLRIDTAIAKKALKDGFITIKGKGGKIREVPINDSIIVVLKKALQTILPGYKLFVPKDKQTHIAKAELQNFIASKRRFVCDEGSSRNLTFHGLRHTFAAEQYKKFIAKGYTETQAKLKVSKLLGHEREDVTRIYLASLKQKYDDG
jgi:integrase